MKNKQHEVFIVWGESNTIAENGEDTISSYSFRTKVELDAFLYGIDEASGWLEYANFKTEKEAKDHVAEYASSDESGDQD